MTFSTSFTCEILFLLKQKHAYFDPLGFGVLGRGDRRAIEQEVQEMHQKIATESFDQPDDDQCDPNSSMSGTSSGKQKHSNVSLFLNSLDTKRVNGASNKQNSKSSTISEEICAYRSLAQREFNLVVHGDKNSDTVRHSDLKRFFNYILSIFYSILGRFLEITPTRAEESLWYCQPIHQFSCNVCTIRERVQHGFLSSPTATITSLSVKPILFCISQR